MQHHQRKAYGVFNILSLKIKFIYKLFNQSSIFGSWN